MKNKILELKDKIATVCNENHIVKFSLFGSILRSDFNQNSDIDVLVEFEPGSRVGFFKIAELELSLSSLFGRKVDLKTANEISKYFRDDVLKNAELIYVQRWSCEN